MAEKAKEKSFGKISFGQKGELNCTETPLDETSGITFTVKDGVCWVKKDGLSKKTEDEAEINQFFTLLKSKFAEGYLERRGNEIFHLHPPKTFVENMKDVDSAVWEGTKKYGTAAKKAWEISPDATLKAALDPDGDGLVNFAMDKTKDTKIHIRDGLACLIDKTGLKNEITDEEKLKELAKQLNTAYCRGKNYFVKLEEGKLRLVSRETEGVVDKAVKFKDRIKKTLEVKKKDAAKEATDEARIAELEENIEVQEVLKHVKRDIRYGMSFEAIVAEVNDRTHGSFRNIEELVRSAIEYLKLIGELEDEEGKEIVEKRNRAGKASKIAEKYGLVRFAQELRKKGVSETTIRTRLEKIFKDKFEAKEKPYAEAAYDFAMLAAKDRKLSGLGNVLNRATSHIPFTPESTWDKLLIGNGLIRTIRRMRAAKVGDHEIEAKLRESLGNRPRVDEIIEYAFEQAGSKKFNENAALRFARDHGLMHFYRDLLKEGKKEKESDEDFKKRLDEELRKKIKEEIHAADPDAPPPPDDKDDKEVAEIMEAAKTAPASKAEAVGNKLKGFWQKIKGIDVDREDVKDWAKYGLLGAAVASILPVAAVGGAGWLAWQILKRAPSVIGATARFGVNSLGQLLTKGGPVLQSLAQTALVNPFKAVGRIVSSPFVGAYQGFNWGRKVPTEPAKYQPKNVKWWNAPFKKPWQWFRNGVSTAAYRAKQAAVAVPAALTFGLYGTGQGVVDALSKDVVGLEWQAPKPADILKGRAGHDETKPHHS